MKKRGIVWFRQDLRLHDNEAIHEATKLCDEILYVYVFDPRWLHGRTSFGFEKTGVHRRRFIHESVSNLAERIKGSGGSLLVTTGQPEVVLFDLARAFRTSWIFCNRERTSEEIEVQNDLEQRLWTIGQEMCYSRGKMLYYTQDLPFPVTHTPDQFTAFRKEVEKITAVREPLNVPDDLKSVRPPEFEDEWPDPGDLESTEPSFFSGGEDAALERLDLYLWKSHAVSTYKETRNGVLGENDSSRLSPWLAQGCLSPKKIYSELKRYEAEVVTNQSTYWLFFELLWRDFFRLMGKKHENSIFKIDGYSGKGNIAWREDRELFNKWAQGNTGTPLIDAAMIELRTTGWLSNRARQIVASYLINDLKVNWLMGAEWFESMLIDYDPCSNYGNWAYVAGVGSDTRPDRYFNILSQARRYDPDGEYVRHWIPSLSHLDGRQIHQPDEMTHGSDNGAVKLPEVYLSPVIRSSRWAS